MKKIVFSLLCAVALFGQENILIDVKDNKILKESYFDKMNLEANKIKEDLAVNKYSWITNLNVKYQTKLNERDNSSDSLVFSIEQPIFKSGGIYAQMKEAEYNYEYDKLGIDIELRDYIKNLNLSKIDYELNKLHLEQSKYKVSNYQIEFNLNKDKYQVGEVDLSVLNNSLIELNNYKNTVEEYSNNIKLNKISFKNLSDKNIDDFKVYNELLFMNLTKENYLKDDLDLKQSAFNEKIKKENLEIIKSNYLPSVSFTGTHTINDSYDRNSQSYAGISINLTLDVLEGKKIESAKLDYKKSQKESEILYDTKMNNYEKFIEEINVINSKIKIAEDNLKSYNELYLFTKEQNRVGFKIGQDVISLENTVKIQELEIKILNLNKLRNMVNYLN